MAVTLPHSLKRWAGLWQNLPGLPKPQLIGGILIKYSVSPFLERDRLYTTNAPTEPSSNPFRGYSPDHHNRRAEPFLCPRYPSGIVGLSFGPPGYSRAGQKGTESRDQPKFGGHPCRTGGPAFTSSLPGPLHLAQSFGQPPVFSAEFLFCRYPEYRNLSRRKFIRP